MRILLVDDEPIALRMLERTVKAVKPDAEYFSFQKAKEAMAFAKENEIDIAFLDIRMRIMDGMAMGKELHALYPRINIIFCTGYSEYAMDAHEIFCSGYLLKPISEERVRDALDNLRYPIEEKKSPIYIHCFGNFEVYYQGKPISFEYQRTKELLAYLVDRNGTNCTTRELIAVLFEDDMRMSYFQKLRHDLITTFEKLGEHDVIRQAKGVLSIKRDAVKCDYFDYRDGKINKTIDEYMVQYSFAEYQDFY